MPRDSLAARRLRPLDGQNEGDLIDDLQRLADAQDDLNAQLKALEAAEEDIEAELVRRFVKQGLEGGRGKLCSVMIKRALMPKMDDYEAFIAAVKRRGDFHMLERRIAVLAWREYTMKNKKPYPGTAQYEKVGLLRSRLATRS